MTVVTPGSETAVHPDRSTRELTDSFIALIDNAEDRVRMMQNKAITEFTKREQRIIRFAAIKKRLKRIISDRLGVLTSQSLFSDAQLTYSDGVGCTAGARSNASTTTITLPISASRHKQMEFSFDVFHDTDVENAGVEYRLQIVPVFVKFVAHDQLIVSIDDQSAADSVAWVDAKLVGFVETYFDVLFHPEYQKPHMVTDPVLGIQFPKSMATGIRDLDGKTIHFFTDESCRLFNENSSYYLGTRFGSTDEPGCMAPISQRN
jgi:YHS domain-containing protein